MTIWVCALNLFMNFCYGSMVVLMPQLNLEAAGLSYSAFFFFRALWYFVAGSFDRRLGSWHGITFSLVLQALALFFIFHFPEWPWIGRILEGVALAQGTVSSLTFLRERAASPKDFSTAIGLVIGLGSLGFVLGPVTAFFLDKAWLSLFGEGLSWTARLLGLSWGGCALFFDRPRPTRTNSTQNDPALAPVDQAFWWPILSVAAIKSVVLGFELNLAWWAGHFLGLSPLMSGASFVALSLCFAGGALLVHLFPPLSMALVGPIGYVLLEYSLMQKGFYWWAGLVAIGFWYGYSISLFYGKLGWQDSDQMGRQNALWLFLTDAPIALLPVFIWPTRDILYSPLRIEITATLLLLSVFGFWKTFSRGFHAPRQNSQ